MTQKLKYKLLRISSQVEDYPKVRTFLESVARGCNNSKNSYEIGLKHLPVRCWPNLQWTIDEAEQTLYALPEKGKIEREISDKPGLCEPISSF